MIKHGKKWVLSATALAFCCLANAQSAGSWSVRAGVLTISPAISSGDLSAPSFPGTKVDVVSDTQLAGGITYMVTDNIAIDMPLSLPFKHDINGAGAIKGVGKIGETKALPISLLGQYRFLATDAQFRPYVTAGVTYAKYFKGKGTAALSALTGGNPTTISIESKWAPTFGVGVSIAINNKWTIEPQVNKTLLKNRSTLSTGQTIDVKQDPLSYGLALGYRF